MISLSNQINRQMHRFVLLSIPVLLFFISPAIAQEQIFEWVPGQSDVGPPHPLFQVSDLPPYAPGFQRGAPSIAGPIDLDGDGKVEVVLTDYSGGGRAHVLESLGDGNWELTYSSLSINLKSNSIDQARGVGVGDLDGDGFGEIYVFVGEDSLALNSPDGAAITTFLKGPSLGILEATGDNTFSFLPDFWNFDTDVPERLHTEQITVADVDGDEINELLFGNSSAENQYDSWYILTANDLGTSLSTFTLEARFSTRATEDYDPVDRGGGGAFGIVPADLDGDGTYEIALSSWNSMNFTNLDVTGPDTYVNPEGENAYYQASVDDDVPFFGCTVVDMDENGDDEIYCPSYLTRGLVIINYESGEDPLVITEENVVFPLVNDVSDWGLTHGDIDKDGIPELIGTGRPYTPEEFAAGNPPRPVTIVDYDGTGNVEDPSSYKVRHIEFEMPEGMIFDTVNRDSAGIQSTYFTTTYLDDLLGEPGLRFGKFAYLGDTDEDGHNEVAASVSGVPDSVYVYNEVFNPADSSYTRTTESAVPHPFRSFMLVLSGEGLTPTFITGDKVIVPTDFELHSNYPNPFNPATTFSFTLPLDRRVSVRVYDITGRLIRTLISDEQFVQGTHSVTWDGLSDTGTAVSSGQYVYTLEWGQFRHSRPMVLVK